VWGGRTRPPERRQSYIRWKIKRISFSLRFETGLALLEIDSFAGEGARATHKS
jgi:hypothetical protein